MGGGVVAWTSSTVVDGVIEESADVVDEERVEERGDVFLIGKSEGSFVRNPIDLVSTCLQEMCLVGKADFYSPNTFQMHGAYLDNMLLFLCLQNTISSASSHTSNVQKLCTVHHMIVCLQISVNSTSGDFGLIHLLASQRMYP